MTECEQCHKRIVDCDCPLDAGGRADFIARMSALTTKTTGELCEDCSSSARALRHDVRHTKPEDCPHYTPGDLDTSHE